MRDAEPQELQVILRDARRVTFEVRGTTVPESDVIEIEVLKGTGEVVGSLRVPSNAPPEQRALWLSAGHYSFNAHSGTKQALHGEFVIEPAGTIESLPVEFR
jgi:hypothetical protein